SGPGINLRPMAGPPLPASSLPHRSPRAGAIGKERDMLRTGVTVIALSLGAANVASAQPAIDTLLSSLARQGFGAFEVKRENGQVKVEGYRGTIERELTYDAATGRLIKDEVNRNDVRDDDRRDDRAARGRDRDDDRADARTDRRNDDTNTHAAAH